MLTDLDRSIYEWQLDVPGFGDEGQEKLRRTTALVSRIGGLGGTVAFQLAAAGIGKLILVHAGNLRKDDLNRQVLMRWDGLEKSRVESASKTLATFNPNIEVEVHDANFDEGNAAELVGRADIVFSCAPLFEERFLMNRECVRLSKPMIDSAPPPLEASLPRDRGRFRPRRQHGRHGRAQTTRKLRRNQSRENDHGGYRLHGYAKNRGETKEGVSCLRIGKPPFSHCSKRLR